MALDADFWIYIWKVVQCKQQRPHDWQSCPCAHPEETARRRHPNIYRPVPCPDMKAKRPCPRGESCPFTHSLFEYWLHPAKFRTCMCESSATCTRRICFFAHRLSELRRPASSSRDASMAAASGGSSAAARQHALLVASAHAQEQQDLATLPAFGCFPSNGCVHTLASCHVAPQSAVSYALHGSCPATLASQLLVLLQQTPPLRGGDQTAVDGAFAAAYSRALDALMHQQQLLIGAANGRAALGAPQQACSDRGTAGTANMLLRMLGSGKQQGQQPQPQQQGQLSQELWSSAACGDGCRPSSSCSGFGTSDPGGSDARRGSPSSMSAQMALLAPSASAPTSNPPATMLPAARSLSMPVCHSAVPLGQGAWPGLAMAVGGSMSGNGPQEVLLLAQLQEWQQQQSGLQLPAQQLDKQWQLQLQLAHLPSTPPASAPTVSPLQLMSEQSRVSLRGGMGPAAAPMPPKALLPQSDRLPVQPLGVLAPSAAMQLLPGALSAATAARATPAAAQQSLDDLALQIRQLGLPFMGAHLQQSPLQGLQL